jgi:hypothetical protein
MKSRGVFVTAWVCVLAVASLGQTSSIASPSSHPEEFGQDPEDAFLSSTSYTNVFFGFAFELPAGAGLRPMPQPASTDRRIQLLELAGFAPGYAGVSISAYEYKNKNYTDAKTLLRRDLDQELFSGVQELHGMSKVNVNGHLFYYFAIRRGVDEHEVLAGELNGYVLEVDLRSRDPKILQELVGSFTNAAFFAPQDAQRRAGVDAKRYQGPAISAEHLREVRESPPAESIDAGGVNGNAYHNQQIGMTFYFPAGWSIESAGAIEPAIEQYRERVTGEPLLGPRERAIVKACRKTLLSVWKTQPSSDGEVPYDEFGEVTLSAMPLSCFPNVRFPSGPNDPNDVRQFVSGLSFTQPLERDMTVARTYAVGGKTFVVTQGTIAYKQSGDALSRRVSVALAMTEQKGYLLIWLMAAPHESELRELMQTRVSFDRETDGAGDGSLATHGGGPIIKQTPSSPGLRLSGEDAATQKLTPGQAAPSSLPVAAPASSLQSQERPTSGQTIPVHQPEILPQLPF